MRISIPAPWLPVIFYAGLIFCFSSIPGHSLPRSIVNYDKILHFFEYLPFGILLNRAIVKTLHRSGSKALLLFVFVVMLYALSDEIHQLYVPGRTFSVLDIVLDCLGALAGGLGFLWLKSKLS